MPSVRIRFVASPGFIGSSIRWVTNSLFQHVEFGTPEDTWIGAHIEDGIQERAADYCKPATEYVYEIPCSLKGRDGLLKWARARIGTKYNTADIIGLLFKNRAIHSPNRFICSQFCADGLLYTFGAGKVLNVRPEYTYLITPETLHLSPLLVGNLVHKKPL